MRLPTVSGSNLERETLTFPADFAGELNLVFIAFQQWHQMEVDTWVPLAESLHQDHPRLAYYEFPTIQSMNRLSRMFINEGMRAGIRHQPTRRRTITLYIEKAPFRQALQIPDEKHISVMLFDRQGEVIWRETGAFTPEKGAALSAAIHSQQITVATV